MSTLETGSSRTRRRRPTRPTDPCRHRPPVARPRKRSRSLMGPFLLFVLLAGLAAGAAYTYKFGLARVQEDGQRLAAYVQTLRPDQGRAGLGVATDRGRAAAIPGMASSGSRPTTPRRSGSCCTRSSHRSSRSICP